MGLVWLLVWDLYLLKMMVICSLKFVVGLGPWLVIHNKVHTVYINLDEYQFLHACRLAKIEIGLVECDVKGDQKENGLLIIFILLDPDTIFDNELDRKDAALYTTQCTEIIPDTTFIPPEDQMGDSSGLFFIILYY